MFLLVGKGDLGIWNLACLLLLMFLFASRVTLYGQLVQHEEPGGDYVTSSLVSL